MDREYLDELLNRIELTALIGRYVPLKRKGRTYWGCCPFHHEKEPSFAVNPDRQFYHCFGCKESGNAIGFVQKIESVDFIDAVRILAEEAKMPLPDLKRDREAQVNREKKDRLYALLKETAQHYHENLVKNGSKHAADYLKARNLDERLVRRFGIGLSLNSSEIIKFLEGKGYTKSEMKEAGLIEQKAADYYDVFYGRLIFPILDNFNRVVGFGGRLIDPGSHIPVKYRNTSATMVFDKSKTLYAINLLKKRKQRGDVPYVIIAEGYMDVIALHRAGFDTAVASMGTALTLAQAKTIRNYANTVYISYDGDGAGQKATLRGLDILAGAGLNVKVISLPDGLDPDDLISSRGSEAYQQLIDEARTLPAFKIDTLAKSFDLATPDGKSKFAIEAIKVVKALSNPVEREEYLSVVRQYTGYATETLRRQADITDAPAPMFDPEPQSVQDDAVEKIPKGELFVVASLLNARPYVSAEDDIYPYLVSDAAKKVYEYCIDCFKAGKKPSPAALFSMDIAGAAAIAEYEFIEGDDENKYKRILNGMKLNHLTAEAMRISAEFDKTKDMKLLNEITKLNAAIARLKSGGEP